MLKLHDETFAGRVWIRWLSDCPQFTQKDTQSKRMQLSTHGMIFHLLHVTNFQATSHVASQHDWEITQPVLQAIMTVTSCEEQTGDMIYQSYRCISASGPRSYSCRFQAETCQKSWKMLSRCHREPKWTGSECLSGEIEIKSEFIPGRKVGLSKTVRLRHSLGWIW